MIRNSTERTRRATRVAAIVEAMKAAVSIPVMAKSRIGHFVEAQILVSIARGGRRRRHRLHGFAHRRRARIQVACRDQAPTDKGNESDPGDGRDQPHRREVEQPKGRETLGGDRGHQAVYASTLTMRTGISLPFGRV